jgi:hypothetical protein
MGKPIAGKDQYPFQINGIIVDGAKINGQTFVKGLYIYKQRSYNYYDLIDSDGNVYEFIEITWRKEDTTVLNYFDNSDYIVESIKDNSFFIKIQDIPRNIYGFITLIQSNKVKVSTGDYIFYNDEDDYALLSVRCIPATIQAKKNQLVSIDVSFLPLDFSNQNGRWDMETSNIAEVGRSNTSTGIFRCLDVGHARVTFNPEANTKLAATAQIFITENEPTYTSFRFMQNVPNGKSLSNDNTFFPGDEVTFTAIFEPFGFVPSHEFDVIYDETVFEYLGSDDFINYKFKVLDDTTFSGVRTRVELRDGNMYAFDQPIIRLPTTSIYTGVEGPYFVRSGESYQYDMAYYSKPVDPSFTWGVQNSSLGTITSDGVYSPVGTGDNRVYQNTNGGMNLNYKNVKCSPYVPDRYVYSPSDRSVYFVGEEIQLTAATIPSSVSLIGGKWRSRNNNDYEYFSVSTSGVLKILKAPDQPTKQFYVGFAYNGSSNGGGTVTDTVEALEKTFMIMDVDSNVPIQSIRIYNYAGVVNVPLGGKTSTQVTVSPVNSTGNKGWTYEMSVAGIVSIEYIQEYNNNFYFTPVIINGLSRGQTDITFTCVQNPEIKVIQTITVY